MWLVLEKRGIHRNPKTVLRIMKLYLSMIRDLNDNSIVAYKTGTEQTVNLVLDTIRHKPAAFSEANEMIGRDISYQGSFFYCPHNAGLFSYAGGLLFSLFWLSP